MLQVYNRQSDAFVRDRESISGEEAQRVDRAAFLVTIALFTLSYLIFCVSPIVNLSDSMYSLALSESILHDHSSHLNNYQFPEKIPSLERPVPLAAGPGPGFSAGLHSQLFWYSHDPSYERSYQLGNLNGNIVYLYPNGSSILSLPFVAFMNATGTRVFVDHAYSHSNEIVIQKMIAALLMALLTCLVFRMSLLMLPTAPSATIAVGLAFGTQVWSTGTRALWPQTWLIFLGGIAVYQILSVELGRSAQRPMLLATILSWMYFVRPTGAIPIACVTVYLLICYRSDFITFAITGTLWFWGFVEYSWLTFGQLIPGYYRNRFDLSHFPSALYGSLFAASRGLFIYVPAIGFVVYLFVRYWRTMPLRRVALLASAIALGNLIAIAAYPCWWGGYCYGARLMMDSLPWLVLLAILGCSAAAAARDSIFTRGEFGAAFSLLALSIAINARGAFSIPTQQWSTVVDVDKHPERVFDWSYPEFAAGLVSPPDYVIANIHRLKQAASPGVSAK